MNIGRWRRAWMARSIVPLPRIGSEHAVQEMTMSNSCRRVGQLAQRDRARRRSARRDACARSSVRLATTIARGRCAAKYVAASSIISPTPMSSTLVSREVAEDVLRRASPPPRPSRPMFAPMPVSVRTSLATAKECWKRRVERACPACPPPRRRAPPPSPGRGSAARRAPSSRGRRRRGRRAARRPRAAACRRSGLRSCGSSRW